MQSVSTQLLSDYAAARTRAKRYLRDSSPPLTQKGLAAELGLEPSAFNQFINGTIFSDANGDSLTFADCKNGREVFFRNKWTSRRLARYVEQVETKCWKLGISHPRSQVIKSAARNEIEGLRLAKYTQYLFDIKDAANLGVASSLALWNVCAQEAQDAREHLRPTMIVKALLALGDIIDRRLHGRLCSVELGDNEQLEKLKITVTAVQELIEAVFELTGSPCTYSHESKEYECFHKAHGYGGYDKYFLGIALGSNELRFEAIEHLYAAARTEHHPNDGHIANAATVTDLAIRENQPLAAKWAAEFRELVVRRLEKNPGDPACRRLADMNTPNLRSHLGEQLFEQVLTKPSLITSLLLIIVPAASIGQSIALGLSWYV